MCLLLCVSIELSVYLQYLHSIVSSNRVSHLIHKSFTVVYGMLTVPFMNIILERNCNTVWVLLLKYNSKYNAFIKINYII